MRKEDDVPASPRAAGSRPHREVHRRSALPILHVEEQGAFIANAGGSQQHLATLRLAPHRGGVEGRLLTVVLTKKTGQRHDAGRWPAHRAIALEGANAVVASGLVAMLVYLWHSNTCVALDSRLPTESSMDSVLRKDSRLSDL